MPEGPFGFPRFTTFGPFVDQEVTVQDVNAYRELVREQLGDLEFGTFTPTCESTVQQRRVCDRLSFLLTDALEALVRAQADVTEEALNIGGFRSFRLQIQETDFEKLSALESDFREARLAAIRAAEEAGLKRTGRGTARVVFTPAAEGGGDCVMKLAEFTFGGTTVNVRGVEENLHARRVWEHAPPGVRDLLAPLKGADRRGRWLVMPRGDVDPGGNRAATFEQRLRNRLPPDWGLIDVKARNLATFDGDEVRLIDYGAIMLPPELQVQVEVE